MAIETHVYDETDTYSSRRGQHSNKHAHANTIYKRERDREREREREYEPPENKEFMKRVLTEFCMVNYIRANE